MSKKRKDLLKNFDGSPQRPIRKNTEFGIWSIEHLTDTNIYVEKGCSFDERFWNKIHDNNNAVIFVEPKKKTKA